MAVSAASAIFTAPATAAPDCTDVAPNTRLCRSPGHTGITTSPDPAFTNPYPGWGFGTLGIGSGPWFGS